MTTTPPPVTTYNSPASGVVYNEYAMVLEAGTHVITVDLQVDYRAGSGYFYYKIGSETFSATVSSNSVIIPDAATIVDTSSGASAMTGGGSGNIHIAGL